MLDLIFLKNDLLGFMGTNMELYKRIIDRYSEYSDFNKIVVYNEDLIISTKQGNYYVDFNNDILIDIKEII